MYINYLIYTMLRCTNMLNINIVYDHVSTPSDVPSLPPPPPPPAGDKRIFRH